jgi:predicted SAM-dependent methyltransferase
MSRFLEGDDYWTDPDKLQIQADFLDKHPGSSACGHNTEILKESEAAKAALDEDICGGEEGYLSAKTIIRWGHILHLSSIMYRSKFAEFPEFVYSIYDMLDMPMTIYLRCCGDIFRIGKTMSAYRFMVANSYSSKASDSFVKTQRFADSIKIYIMANEYSNNKYEQFFAVAIIYTCCHLPNAEELIFGQFKRFYELLNPDDKSIIDAYLSIIKKGTTEMLITYDSPEALIQNTSKSESIKLHLGCGTVYKDGWINIDNNSDFNIQKLDLAYDLANGLPFPDNYADYIFHEHFIEHLSYRDGSVFLRECLRVLKPGGIMRFSTPDLNEAIREYQDPEIFLKNKPIRDSYGYGNLSPCITFNLGLREWGHQFIYDKPEIQSLLVTIGANRNNITFCASNESTDPALCNLETRIDTGFVIAEVRK